MAELYENKEAARERVILVGVCTRENENVEESLDELAELADTAGAEAVGRVIQNRESMHPGTYIGSGKIDEVRELAAALQADGVICDDELTPAQLRGLEQELDLKVMDRTLVILDIFAQHATTSEGKLQVELAQLQLSSGETYRKGHRHVQTGRRYRYQRSRREEAGDGPETYQESYCPPEPGIKRDADSPGYGKKEAPE